jgi:predicted DNA-binding transcriptional regulator AlpA
MGLYKLKKLYKTSEICGVLGVSRQCIYKWRKQEYDPMPVAINNTKSRGKFIRYDLDEVIDWLNGRGNEDRAEVLRQEAD